MLVNNNISSYQFNPGALQPIEKKEAVQDNATVDKLLESQPSRQNNAMLRKAAEEVATTNKEQEIADSLINAIDDHTTQLEAIANWTDGGLNAFKGAIEMIAQNMMTNKPTDNSYGSYYEDLFQLVLMDVLANAKEYGVENDPVFMQFLSWSLEYVGTGQHNSWVETLPDPENCRPGEKPVASGGGGNAGNHLVKIVDCVWYGIQKKIKDGAISQDSLAGRLMKFISSNGNSNSANIDIPTHLPSSIYNNLYTAKNTGGVVSEGQGFYNSESGGWITDKNNHMSPLMRLTLMSYILKDKGELSTPHVNTIMYGSLEKINELYKKLFNVQDSAVESQRDTIATVAENVYLYIIRWNKDNTVENGSDNSMRDGTLEKDNNGWQNSAANDDPNARPPGVTISLDFAGELDFKWLKDLSQNYPQRILGDEDIKEINRLGDSAKMIMQTLKYWFQIMRDERAAIARNI
ncbi:molecular chaperone [Grimontia hollisae]|uniref:molecular chaperone n=1 Tax=Grimontia hollisae TaxID=673 RepID=UPI0023DA6421|nr:molecular chaperone [Grimontia hollisae]MDF2185983.1 molecular chaperone [Grimontia hollisae]